MSFISKFKTDTAYSNVDINQVLSAITGQGVLPFSPNEILLSVADDGVTLSDGRCEVVWADDSKSSVKISPGTVIMADGSYIVISDEILPVSSDSHIYIYNDIVLQNIPVCSETLPDDASSYVLLASIQDGKIIDKRKLATSKIADFGTHPVVEVSGEYTINKNKIPAGESFLSFDVGEGYTHMILTTSSETSISIYNFEKGVFEKSLFTSYDSHFHTNEKSIYFGLFDYVSVSYVNGVISLHSSTDLYSAVHLNPSTFYLKVF